MFKLKNENVAIPVVLIAGILWSFGPLVVRYMDQPELVPWQYLFARGITIFIILNLYLFFEEGLDFYKNYQIKFIIRTKYPRIFSCPTNLEPSICSQPIAIFSIIDL